MSYRAILVASLLATLCLASPIARQASTCEPNASSFTLVSVSKTDSTIQNLALGLNGLPTGSPVAFIGSAESIDSIAAENFDLVNGGITAYGPDESPVFVSNYVANENGWLSFLENGLTAPAQEYCELVNTSPDGVAYPYTLAVDGDGDNFSLCKSNLSDEFVVIYNAVEASSEDAGYDFTTCDAVDVYVL